MYVGWRSDELSGHATEVLKAKCTWLVGYKDGLEAARLSRRSPDA
jgi:hypothetical protein